jgi:riboflavin synthase
MFTGIIEELGLVKGFDKGREPSLLSIKASKVVRGLKTGDSVSVNGTCLTVVDIDGEVFSVEAVRQTLELTTIGQLKTGDMVNLESALAAGSRIGGHFVTGHIDCTGEISSRTEKKAEISFKIKAGKEIMKGIVNKGSVAVDGISLTVGDVGKDYFIVYVIPHTAKMTTLGSRKAGDKINIETDILGKYIERCIIPDEASGITMEFLREKGFV